ncbi:MAG: GntR family transcriptional regulator, partial [Actinobacteria bacterium]|nr:GntR family transcriptional regulator [Actinomycetota bacterium]
MLDGLDRSNSRPLYQQIKERLREMAIHAQPGQKLFTDEELAGLFKVSRMTVRQAVQELVQEGFLYRVRGAGTFLKPPQVKGQVTEIERFFYEWSLQGRNTAVEVTDFEEVPCPFAPALQLGIAPETPVFYTGRLRYIDGIPLAVDHRYLPMTFGRLLSREDVASRSIFEVIQERLGLPSVWARNELQAVPSSAEDAELLRIAPGTPLMMRRVTIYTHENQPFLAGTSAYRGDLFVYTFDVPGGDHRVRVETIGKGVSKATVEKGDRVTAQRVCWEP